MDNCEIETFFKDCACRNRITRYNVTHEPFICYFYCVSLTFVNRYCFEKFGNVCFVRDGMVSLCMDRAFGSESNFGRGMKIWILSLSTVSAPCPWLSSPVAFRGTRILGRINLTQPLFNSLTNHASSCLLSDEVCHVIHRLKCSNIGSRCFDRRAFT
jgi:hypothetical protein